MWENAGIARSDARLELRQLSSLEAQLDGAGRRCWRARLDTATIELRNLVEVSALIVHLRAAATRESRPALQRRLSVPGQ
jgi:aspartate oxidase